MSKRTKFTYILTMTVSAYIDNGTDVVDLILVALVYYFY